MMKDRSSLWDKLANSKEYREAFAAAQLKRGVPLQIRLLMKQRGWSQEKLANEANLTQGVVSRAQDPDYGNLTFNTVSRIAAGFDLVFWGRFISFNQLVENLRKHSEESLLVPSFAEDKPPEDRLPYAVDQDVVLSTDSASQSQGEALIINVTDPLVSVSENSRKLYLWACGGAHDKEAA